LRVFRGRVFLTFDLDFSSNAGQTFNISHPAGVKVERGSHMSMGIGHFAVGASTSLFVLQMLPIKTRQKIPGHWFIVIVSGLWAMLPDISKLSHHFDAFHDSIWANVFFFHQVMDKLDKTDGNWASGVAVLFMAVLALIMWVQELWYRLGK
jgi:hypothetical protein